MCIELNYVVPYYLFMYYLDPSLTEGVIYRLYLVYRIGGGENFR